MEVFKQVKEPGELSGTCQSLGGFAAHVFDFNRGFTQGMSLTFLDRLMFE